MRGFLLCEISKQANRAHDHSLMVSGIHKTRIFLVWHTTRSCWEDFSPGKKMEGYLGTSTRDFLGVLRGAVRNGMPLCHASAWRILSFLSIFNPNRISTR